MFILFFLGFLFSHSPFLSPVRFVSRILIESLSHFLSPTAASFLVLPVFLLCLLAHAQGQIPHTLIVFAIVPSYCIVPLVKNVLMIQFFIHSFSSSTSDYLILPAYGWPLTSVCVSFQVRSLHRRRKLGSCVNIPIARNAGSLPRWAVKKSHMVWGNPSGVTQTGTLSK